MTGPAAKEQSVDLAAVENLVQVLMKGLRAIQLYLPNNPIHQKAVANIRTAFDPVWEQCPELELQVTETEFIWEENVVFSWEDKSDSVAWALYKDGVRTLLLLPGVEDNEIINLLDVIHKARNLAADAADDLLTLFWEQDFQHVRYVTIEVGEDGAAPLEPSADGWRAAAAPPAEQVRKQVEEDAEGEADGPTGIVSTEDFDSTLYFLDEAELDYLKREIEREYEQDLRANVIARVFDLMELQTYTTVRAELISITENLLPYLLGVGDFNSVAYVLRELRVILERARELGPEHRKALDELPAKLSQADALDQLFQSLDEAVVHPTEQELNDLFGELRPEALRSVLVWLPKLSSENVRELLENAAQRLAQAHPQQVVETLETADGDVLLDAIRLVAKLKLPPFVAALGALLQRDDAGVRHAAVDALAATGSSGALRELENAIDDEDRETRLAAVRVLGERGHRRAFPKIEAVVAGKALKHLDLSEKKAFFEAYGRLAGAPGIKVLQPLLETKGLLRRREDPETRACAAMALGKIGNPEAQSLLEQIKGEKEPIVRNAVAQALREVRAT